MGLRRLVATVPRVGAVAGALALVMALAFLVANHGDVSNLVHAAPPWTNAATAPPSLSVRDSEDTFDGQFYFRLARHPLSSADEVDGVTLDIPSLRSARILYPATAWVVSLHQAPAVPWALLGINVVAMGIVGWLGAVIATDLGRAPAWGLLFAVYPGFVYTLGFDLAELTEAAVVLGAICLFHRKRYVATGLVLTAAALTKETGTTLAFGLGVAWLWEWVPRSGHPRGERPKLLGAAPAAIPAVAFGVWQLVLMRRFDELPLAPNSANNLRAPFAGLVDVADRFAPTSGENLFRDLQLALLLGVMVLVAIVLRRSNVELGLKIAWVAAILLVVVLSENVWGGATSFMRAGTESYLLGLTIILGADRIRAMDLVAPGVVGMSALTLGSELVKA